jgi:c(7)-type cytochrome triheme protein
MNKKVIVVLLLVGAVICPSLAQMGTKQKRPLPWEYGLVIIDNYSQKAGRSPVVFEHWIHRAKFTCRVCHVDIGFAMKAGGTGITASDNVRGYYCGTCHNGKRVFADGKTAFQACSQEVTAEDSKRCDRCHSWGKDVKSDFDFLAFSAPLPKGRFGNGIDWEKAEEVGLIRPVSFIEGEDGALALNRFLASQADFELNPKVAGLPDIIFSHEKHTRWNGCELCHPDIFIGVQRGDTQYAMVDNFHGEFCGGCHNTVAFPLTDCQRCHSKPVQF